MYPNLTSDFSHSRGLFDHLPNWLDDPVATYTAWLEVHPLEDSSREVKEFMWGNWCRWMAKKGLRLDRIGPHHLTEFCEEEEKVPDPEESEEEEEKKREPKKQKIRKGQRQRYLRMIELVYIHLSLLGLSIKNPGSEAGKARLGKEKNDPTVFLTHAEKEKVDQVIRTWLAMPVEDSAESPIKGREEKKRRGRKKQQWVRVRDAAVCGVMIGGGATVYATERMTVSCTNKDAPGQIALPCKGGADYLAMLMPIGQEAIECWLRQRKELGAGFGKHLFPADARARINPDTFTGTAGMSPSAIFRAVRGLFTEAGITGARACGQTLRNTYGATLVDLGLTPDEIAANMGFVEPNSARRLAGAWKQAQQPT